MCGMADYLVCHRGKPPLLVFDLPYIENPTSNFLARVAEGQPACQAGLTGHGPGLTCQAKGLAYQAGPRPP